MPPAWPTGFIVVRAGQSENVVVQPADAPPHILAGFALQYAHFADCIRDGRPPLISESDSLGNARAIEMLLDSARRFPTMPGKEEVNFL
jgi:predicted dehydrogenase